MMLELKKQTLLLVDDNPKNLQVLGEMLESLGCEIAFAMSGEQVLSYVAIDKPDLILLDIMMPDMDGYEVCRLLKQDEETKGIPVVFLTAKTDINSVIKGFEEGGVDYITKPFNSLELKSRVKTHLELKQYMNNQESYIRKLKQANELVVQKNEQLSQMMEQLELVSKTDPLTRIYNRRCINEKLQEELVRYKRNRKKFSVIVGDIDFFKKVNDSYGHSCGDEVLVGVATLLRSSVRAQDSVARWGGEEFLLLLPETDHSGAIKLAENIRHKVEQTEFRSENEVFHITMTFGVCEYDEGRDIDYMIRTADNSLYEGKHRGRNCVV